MESRVADDADAIKTPQPKRSLGSAQMMGNAVLSGMSVGPAITLGRIVARNAWQYAQLRASSQAAVCAQQSTA